MTPVDYDFELNHGLTYNLVDDVTQAIVSELIKAEMVLDIALDLNASCDGAVRIEGRIWPDQLAKAAVDTVFAKLTGYLGNATHARKAWEAHARNEEYKPEQGQ